MAVLLAMLLLTQGAAVSLVRIVLEVASTSGVHNRLNRQDLWRSHCGSGLEMAITTQYELSLCAGGLARN